MYKVILIDDEPIIVEGLSRMIPWDKYNCQIVGTANDGIEGGVLIHKLQPDILFSDIAMPGLSGLSMIAGLKSELPEMKITILTGYRDFEYAQEAIRLGVSRFILKPSRLEDIEEAMNYMTSQLNRQRKELFPKEKKEEAPAISEQEQVQNAGSFIVNNAIKYMEEHYKEKLTLSEVAEKVYVSQWHLSKLLNKHGGKNFSELLNTIRIEAAKELLKNPALRIGDVSEAVGFVDMAHFSRVFKKITGTSANEFRNTCL